MRGGGLLGVIALIWLLIGVFAAWQRDYFNTAEANCATAASIALTVLAGPLNYFGVNPQVECNVTVPQPSASAAQLVGSPPPLMIGVAS